MTMSYRRWSFEDKLKEFRRHYDGTHVCVSISIETICYARTEFGLTRTIAPPSFMLCDLLERKLLFVEVPVHIWIVLRCHKCMFFSTHRARMNNGIFMTSLEIWITYELQRPESTMHRFATMYVSLHPRADSHVMATPAEVRRSLLPKTPSREIQTYLPSPSKLTTCSS